MIRSVSIVCSSLFFLVSLCCSCGNVRDLQYFQGQFDTAKLKDVVYPEPLIQKNELLSITVYSDDPRASSFYNLPAAVGSSAPTTTINSANTNINPGSSYLVDEQGNIQFPGLGTLTVAGLNKDQLYKILDSKLKDKLSNPYFIIRLSSYKVTMIGELAKPGIFTIPNERVSLLEAIALAGDLTVYGRRENILIIREINGQRTFGRVDIKDPNIMASPYFYLQPNDVVYVDLNKTKASANDAVAVRNITILLSVISVAAVVISLSRSN